MSSAFISRTALKKYGYACSSGSDGKESICNAGDLSLIFELGRFIWRRVWQATPVFLPGKSP